MFKSVKTRKQINHGEFCMDLKNLTVFSLANQNMHYLSAKERVIAANIANASTPGYMPKEIETPSFLKTLEQNKQYPLAATDSKHFNKIQSTLKPETHSGFKVFTQKPHDALTIDGNGVILEEQMNEASKASSEYKKMITIYNTYKNMLSTANTKING